MEVLIFRTVPCFILHDFDTRDSSKSSFGFSFVRNSIQSHSIICEINSRE